MISVAKSLEYISANPQPRTDIMLDLPVWELVGRTLFEIANSPDMKVRGSLARATRAQKIIMDRLVGTRRPGSHPVAAAGTGVDFHDLTQGVLE